MTCVITSLLSYICQLQIAFEVGTLFRRASTKQTAILDLKHIKEQSGEKCDGLLFFFPLAQPFIFDMKWCTCGFHLTVHSFVVCHMSQRAHANASHVQREANGRALHAVEAPAEESGLWSCVTVRRVPL